MSTLVIDRGREFSGKVALDLMEITALGQKMTIYITAQKVRFRE